MVMPPVEAATPVVVVDHHSVTVDPAVVVVRSRAVDLVAEAHAVVVVAGNNPPSTHLNSSIRILLMW